MQEQISKGKNASMNVITTEFQKTMSGHKRSSSMVLTTSQKIRRLNKGFREDMNSREIEHWFQEFSEG